MSNKEIAKALDGQSTRTHEEWSEAYAKQSEQLLAAIDEIKQLKSEQAMREDMHVFLRGMGFETR
jgi:DNA-binding transcriptional MerR regulator